MKGTRVPGLSQVCPGPEMHPKLRTKGLVLEFGLAVYDGCIVPPLGPRRGPRPQRLHDASAELARRAASLDLSWRLPRHAESDETHSAGVSQRRPEKHQSRPKAAFIPSLELRASEGDRIPEPKPYIEMRSTDIVLGSAAAYRSFVCLALRLGAALPPPCLVTLGSRHRR